MPHSMKIFDEKRKHWLELTYVLCYASLMMHSTACGHEPPASSPPNSKPKVVHEALAIAVLGQLRNHPLPRVYAEFRA